MLIFRHGTIEWANATEIFDFDDEYEQRLSMFEKTLQEDVYIVSFKDEEEVYYGYAENLGMSFIPRHHDFQDMFHELIWQSRFTFIFAKREEAISYFESYEGNSKENAIELVKMMLEDEREAA